MWVMRNNESTLPGRLPPRHDERTRSPMNRRNTSIFYSRPSRLRRLNYLSPKSISEAEGLPSKMLSPLFILTATALLHGVSCHLFPQAVLNQLVTNVELATKQYKRQTTNEMVPCISDKLDAAFRGNTSSFVSECKSAAREEIDLSSVDNFNTSNFQSLVSSIYRTFCVRDCGDVVLDAYNDCGLFDVGLPGTKELNIGLCGTNENGILCYKLYGEGLTFIKTELSCLQLLWIV